MVAKNGFAVEIIPSSGGVEQFTDYVALSNNTEYSIRLCNNRDTGCDVHVKIDNQTIGGWKIDPNSCITIERPGDDAHRFTFFSEISSEAIGANVNIGSSTNGLIEVTFYPQRRSYRPIPIPYRPTPILSQAPQSTMMPSQSLRAMPASRSGYESGVTLMGRGSYQQFSRANPLHPDEIDWDNVTTIYLRIVAKRGYDQPRYYRYQSRPNIPPRIDDYPYFPSPNPPYFPSPNIPVVG